MGELVKLDFMLPLGRVSIYAIGRQRSAFRYGFQFVESNAMHEVIQTTCHYLADAKSLIPKL